MAMKYGQILMILLMLLVILAGVAAANMIPMSIEDQIKLKMAEIEYLKAAASNQPQNGAGGNCNITVTHGDRKIEIHTDKSNT